jgi:hypothetical protein
MDPTRRRPTGLALSILLGTAVLAATGCGLKTESEASHEKQQLASKLKGECDRDRRELASRHEAEKQAVEADLSRCQAQELALARACPGGLREEDSAVAAPPGGAQDVRTSVIVSPLCGDAAMAGAPGAWPPPAAPIRPLSEPYYSRFAERVVPVDRLAEQVKRSTFDLEYRCADERWYWSDREFTFREKAVLLGQETTIDGTWWVLLTTRCAVDSSAPGRRDQVTGTFEPDMVSRGLQIVQTVSDGSPPRTVFRTSFRWWGDARRQLRVEYPDKDKVDIALVYVAADSAAGAALAREQNLGVVAPGAYVRALARSVTNIFGIDFRLVSAVCHELMLDKLAEYRKAKTVAGVVGLVLAGAVAVGTVYYGLANIPNVADFAASVVPSLLRQFGVAEPANVARRAIADVFPQVVGELLSLPRGLAPSAPPAVALAVPASDATSAGIAAPGGLFRTESALEYRPGATGTAFGMLLVDLRDLPAPALDEINRAVGYWTEGREVVASFFPKRAEDPGDAQALLFVPSRRMTLNYELVRNGLAKLGFEDTDVLERYPEMVAAAADALEDGVGWACIWSHDDDYVDKIEQTMKHLVEMDRIAVRPPPPRPTAPQAPTRAAPCPPPRSAEVGPTACDDDADNDGDGYTDCADQDCWSVEACARGESGRELARPDAEAPAEGPGGPLPGDAGPAAAAVDAAASGTGAGGDDR